eukprot:COSAG04_NODE_2995_length_3298_cov_1.415442_4_plen_43_part_00
MTEIFSLDERDPPYADVYTNMATPCEQQQPPQPPPPPQQQQP